jgi:type IV pilus assembly protein PilC
MLLMVWEVDGRAFTAEAHRPRSASTGRVMFFSPRIAPKALAELCHRLSMALEAGIDVRTVLAREAERAYGPLRRHLRDVSHDIERGEDLSTTLRGTRGYFPLLVCELVRVGEETGHLDTIFAQLAEHYQSQIALRRQFLRVIAGPLVQLGLSILVIGGLIWFIGILRELTGNKTLDILGFGLAGNQGLLIYSAIVGGSICLLIFLIRAVSRGALWLRPIQYFVLRLPGIGGPVRTLALARLAWSLHLTMNAGMSLRRALELSLRSTHNACFVDQIGVIDHAILGGSTLHEAFRDTGAYPPEFLDALAVAEESGKLVETMAILSRQYRERAAVAIAALTTIAAWIVWAGIVAIIVTMIFRVFGFYLEILNNATGVNQKH